MYETNLTVVGNVATDPVLRRTMDGTAVVNFRLASTERRYDRDSGGWIDGEKLFLAVSCWRKLAESVYGALGKGDPVVVVGKVYTRNFEHDGQARVSTDMTATCVGPDLARCRADVQRTGGRSAVAQEGMSAELAA